MPPSGQHDSGGRWWCAASGAAFALICREQHGDFVVACSEMPPSGQHDSGGRWWCAASGVAFAVICREQQ
jgi:hypothetical protein